MNFTSIKNGFYRRNLASQLKGGEPTRETLNLKKAKTIGILFNCTGPENIVVVNKYAKRLKEDLKRVHLLGLFESKKDHDFGFPYFNKKDINWYGKPSGNYVNDFIKHPFDILINAYLEDSRPLAYISCLSNAKFRIGQYQPFIVQGNDFMFKVSESVTLESYLKQIDYYLNYVRGKS